MKHHLVVRPYIKHHLMVHPYIKHLLSKKSLQLTRSPGPRLKAIEGSLEKTTKAFASGMTSLAQEDRASLKELVRRQRFPVPLSSRAETHPKAEEHQDVSNNTLNTPEVRQRPAWFLLSHSAPHSGQRSGLHFDRRNFRVSRLKMAACRSCLPNEGPNFHESRPAGEVDSKLF